MFKILSREYLKVKFIPYYPFNKVSRTDAYTYNNSL